jgi:hypothetical protein
MIMINFYSKYNTSNKREIFLSKKKKEMHK